MRVMICRRSERLAEEARRALVRGGAHFAIGCIASDRANPEALRGLRADAFLMDCVMPYIDGPALAEALAPTPCVLITSGVQPRALPGHVLCIDSLDGLHEALSRIASRELPASVRSRITWELMCMGFRPQTRGFHQLSQAMAIALRDEGALSDMRGRVYRVIAHREGCSAASVERNLRYAIECAWVRGDLTALQERFGYTVDQERGKPTNRAFLAQLAEHIRLHDA